MPKIEVTFLDSGTKEEYQIEKSNFIIGRSSKADLVIPREEFSRFHLEIDCSNDQIHITDLNSTNGVFVNGERIPKGLKVLHQIIFPIEIAGKISILLHLDEVVEEQEFKPQNFNYSSRKKSQQEDTATSTKTLRKPEKSQNNQNRNYHFKKNTNSKNQFPSIVILTLLGIGLVTYYFYQNKNSNPTISNNDFNLIEKKELKFEPKSTNFKNLILENQCSNFTELCSEIQKKFKDASINIKEESFFVFFNLNNNVVENPHKKFQDFEELIKTKIYLSELASNTNLLSKAKELKSKHLIVVGYSKIESDYYFKYLLEVDYEALLNTKKNFSLFFSDIYYGGIKKGYKKFIEPFISFHEL